MNEKIRIDIKQYQRIRRDRLIKLIILIILVLLILITSFKTGQKFYEIKNTNFNSTNAEINSDVAKWNFKAKLYVRK